ncbi:hypothetical protein GOP47_0024740, partial [Adiantum capillus-veneris]
IKMAEEPPPRSLTTDSRIAPSEFNTKSFSNHTNMACKGAQRKILSPPNAAENCNPNINQGSCKRKINSSPRTGSTDQSNASINASKHQLAGQACADFNLISPPRKHMCGLKRCASKNPEYAVPATAIPKKFLVSNGGDFDSQEAPKTCECTNKSGYCVPDDQTASMRPCNCMSPHDTELRRWSSDDKDCRSLVEVGTPSPFSHPREAAIVPNSSQSDAFTQVSTKAANCLETAHRENAPIKSWSCSNDYLSLQAGDGSIHSQNVRSEVPGLAAESYIDGADREGAAVSPSPEKTGNWRLNAVLEAFGSLSPTREGRVKTLVRAFESLLSVKDKSNQEAGSKPRSYPLQFSYLSSDGKESSNERGTEDGGTTVNEENGIDEPWGRLQDAEPIYNQQEHTTNGGRGDEKDGVADGIKQQLGRYERVEADETGDGLGEQGYACSPAWGTSIQEQASRFEVLKEEEGKQERQQNLHHEHVISVPQEKLLSNQKPRAEFRRYSLQRFSMDGHSSTAAARKKVCSKSRKPSLGSSSCAMPPSRPPLAHKTQLLPPPEKPRISKPQPFKLLTQERGYMKEQEFVARLKRLIEEEEKLRVPLAQGLPWTTDEPEIPQKPPVKENTIPLDIHLNSDQRAIERAEFDCFIAEKLLHIEQRRMEEEKLSKIAEEEEIKRMRHEMVPKAQLMPYFDRPFRPRRSSKRPTIPKEPQFQLNSKQSKRQKCVSSSLC